MKLKNTIKFLLGDGKVAFLCPYCMMHVSGIISKCPECGHEAGSGLDLRMTEKYKIQNNRLVP